MEQMPLLEGMPAMAAAATDLMIAKRPAVEDAEATLAGMTATPESAAVTDVIVITVPGVILLHMIPVIIPSP